ncbi:MAG: AAA family ATPase [Saprospiraceae bacterium]
MFLRTAERKQAFMKMALQGSAGSGKTYSALLLAKGLVSDWSKIAVIDTEMGSSNLYAHLGPFQVLTLEPPHTPERYIEAIQLCLNGGMEAVVIDSISHCWENLLDYHGSLQGNSFANWNKVTPRHRAFVDTILQAKAHIVATMRSKTEYTLSDKNGKQVPEKMGLKAIQRDGVDYEFTLVFDLDNHHQAKASKDRTSLFVQKPEFVIDESTGEQILQWCKQGTSEDEVRSAVYNAGSVDELNALYRQYPTHATRLINDFKERKVQLLNTTPSVNHQKPSTHGFIASNQ